MKSNLIKYRDLGLTELAEELKNTKEELFNLRFSLATQRLTDNSQVKKARKKIAQIHTVIREKELQTSKKEA